MNPSVLNNWYSERHYSASICISFLINLPTRMKTVITWGILWCMFRVNSCNRCIKLYSNRYYNKYNKKRNLIEGGKIFSVQHPVLFYFFPDVYKFDDFQFTSLCKLSSKKWSAVKGGESIRNFFLPRQKGVFLKENKLLLAFHTESNR